jgi:DAK2 domain
MGCFSSVPAVFWTAPAGQVCRSGPRRLKKVSARSANLGGAKPGDRTMLDARDSFVRSLKSAEASFSREILRAAVIEAHRGAEARAISEAVFAN